MQGVGDTTGATATVVPVLIPSHRPRSRNAAVGRRGFVPTHWDAGPDGGCADRRQAGTAPISASFVVDALASPRPLSLTSTLP